MLFAVLGMAAVAVGCGGGGGGATPAAIQTGVPNAAVKFVVVVPAKAATRARQPSNLLSFAESVVVTLVQAPAPPSPTSVAIDLQAGATDCNVAGKSRDCSQTMIVPAGEEQFTVYVYSKPGGNGALLAAGAIPTTDVQAGSSAYNLKTILLTLSSIVKSIKLTVTPDKTTVGAKQVFELILTAYDATGAIILGPGNYSPPLAIKLDDPDKFFGSSPFERSVDAPGPAVDVRYDGENKYSMPGGGHATFIASGGTLKPASARVTFEGIATPTPSPTPRHSPTPFPTLTPVPTFSASPTPTPPPTPKPQFTVTPTMLTFAGTAPQPTQTFTASEPGVTSFTATSQNTSIATVSGSGTTFTVTAGSASGQTLIVVEDPSDKKATVTVIVSGQVIIISSKPRTRHR
jgi:hypothetical protein